jgi:DNA polymerase-1
MNPSGTLYFDVETHERNQIYEMPPEQFVRLIGYAWDEGDVVITTDLEEMREQILKARWIVGHNIHAFDLRAVFGIESNIPMQLADERRVYDTWTHAGLVNPCPRQYTNRFGKVMKEPTSSKIPWMKKWFSLDEQAYQLGVTGKTADLSDLAKEFGDPDLPLKERKKDGYGKIPLDDERFVNYLIGDVKASRAIAKALYRMGPLDTYALREQQGASRLAVIESNGMRLDKEKAQARSDYLASNRDRIMSFMVERYDFPTTGKKPWDTKPGKEAITKALADFGITEGSRPTWPRTGTGALQLGGKVLLELAEDASDEAKELCQALAELKGQRSLADLALSCVYSDGFVHPEISMLQKSGRTSTTDPGLTVWTSGSPEKEYFIPDNEDEVLLEIDLSNADARIVAWYSGDADYAVRFEPGADGHLINAWAAWGKDVVGTDKHDPVTHGFRQKAKPLGHGWSYGGGYKTLSAQAKVALEDAKAFCEGMAKAFPRIISWQNAVRGFARANGYVMNKWGRKMPVDHDRIYTQSPALMGQSGTRELMFDTLIAMPHNVVRKVKALIHDAYLLSVPRARFEACRDYLVELMTVTLPAPAGGQEMHFPAEAGPPGDNWLLAEH